MPPKECLGTKSHFSPNPEGIESPSGTVQPARMSQSLSKILLHAVFSTKDRVPFLQNPAIREEMYGYLGGILENLECHSIAAGGVSDHVHLLFTLSRIETVADVIKEVKRSSSAWVKTKSPPLKKFAWQSGYGVFSVGFSQVKTVRAYIAGQEKRHRKISFQDEVREFLRRYEIDFDERYVWD
jgi:REP element-mobilizing transposase RayT